MASIFDLLGGVSPEQNQGLLAAAAQVLRNSGPGRPYSFGQGLGDAIGAYQGYGEHQKKQKMLEQRMAQEQQLTDFAIRDKKSDYEAQERARAQADRIAKRLSGIPSTDAAPAAPEYMASAMPGAEGSPKIGGPDWLQAYQQQNGLQLRPPAGGKPANQTDAYVQRLVSMAQVYAEEGNLEGANKLYEQAAKLRPEFDTTPRVANDANGKPYQYLVGKRGEIQRIEGALPREEMKLMNLGGKERAYNPFELQSGQTFQRTMTPGEAAANSLGWANHGLSKERVAIERAEAATRAAVGKAPTEFQGKSAAFGLRATEADKIISELTGAYSPAAVNAKTNVEGWPLVGGALGAAVNKFKLDANDQKAEQAQRDFINAVLRQESGAAIGDSEFDNARKQYFPQPGDGPDVIAQKARNRQLAIQGFQSNAGRAAMTAPPRATTSGGWSIQRVD